MSALTEDLFREALIEEARHPQQYGEMAEADFIFKGTNASCGDEVTLYFKVSDKEDPDSAITDFSWTGSGCVISQAAASVFSALVLSHSLSLAKAAEISQTTLEETLGLENISINRVKCLLLAVTTVKQHL